MPWRPKYLTVTENLRFFVVTRIRISFAWLQHQRGACIRLILWWLHETWILNHYLISSLWIITMHFLWCILFSFFSPQAELQHSIQLLDSYKKGSFVNNDAKSNEELWRAQKIKQVNYWCKMLMFSDIMHFTNFCSCIYAYLKPTFQNAVMFLVKLHLSYMYIGVNFVYRESE